MGRWTEYDVRKSFNYVFFDEIYEDNKKTYQSKKILIKNTVGIVL